jgi:uncharacterized secreted protein with C-terminal beta-propeller domain
MTAAFFSLSPPVIAEETQPINPASLESVESCPALLEELKKAAIEEMETRVDANRQSAIRGDMCWRYTAVGGGCANCNSAMPMLTGGAAPPPPSAASPMVPNTNSGGADSAADYSETNVQVTGVDEADFIKNDGAYIYILAEGKFRIVDAWPPEQASEISAFEIEGTPKKLFVHEERAFIYSSLDPIAQNNDYSYSFGFGNPNGYGTVDTECTYGYDCDFTGDGRELKITVLDLSDVAAPRMVRETRFSGSYLNSRRIGNAVYSVVVFPETSIKGLKYWPDDIGNYSLCNEEQNTDEQINATFDALKADNQKHILSMDISHWFPSMKDVRYDGENTQENNALLESCDNFYRTTQKDGANFLSIISTEVSGAAPLNATTIMGKPGAVYASSSALYVAARHSQQTVYSPWFFPDDNSIEEASTIHKFALVNNPPAAQYIGSGVVKGRVLNQFAMDEFQGFFRLATTTGHLPDPKTHSTISILEEKQGELTVIGQIDNIAPTEDIRSARFMGDKGYIVTFKKADPLFVFDLSEPRKPTIAGELKIPGFSTYMHRLDENHLLTIGYDADDQGSFAWFQGIMLQIFDVSDMKNPLLVHKEVIGTRGSTSEAATNHLAFNYFGSKGLLAIPMTICEKDEQLENRYGGSFGDLMTFSGLLVYKVNAETGFELVGGVPHIAPESQDNYRGACSNWWTDSNSYVKRSVFMEDYVYSVTEDTIKINSLYNMGKDVAVVYFAEAPQCDAFHVNLCAVEPDCRQTNANWNESTCRLPRYSPKRALGSFADLCTANYDALTGYFYFPCVNVAGDQHGANLSISSPSPLQFQLNALEVTEMKIASRGCEIAYDSDKETLHVPCVNYSDTTYWVDFLVRERTPFIMELKDFGVK